MNDFTKEELQFLYECLDDEISTFRLANNSYCCTMRDKIQSMIDKYHEHECDHEWDGVLISDCPNTGKCKKCDTICYIVKNVWK
jgi:hypothetical protein